MDLFGRKRKKREKEFKEVVARFETQQASRTPAAEPTWFTKMFGENMKLVVGPKEVIGEADGIGASRVIKQGTTGVSKPKPYHFPWYVPSMPLITISNKNGRFAIEVDKVRLNELRDTTRMYLNDPKIAFDRVLTQIQWKYAQHQAKADAALFV